MIEATARDTKADPAERRRFQRVDVVVTGRYMLQDRQDYPCQTLNISPGGLLLRGPVKGVKGERVIAYLDHIGRIEGQVARLTVDGFAMTVAATARKRDKMAAQLTWLANRKALGLPEDRRHDRITPRQSRAVLTLEDGSEHLVELGNISLSGAALVTSLRPEIGASVRLGKVPARIVRFVEGGIALEFSLLLTEDTIDDQLFSE